jgi:arylsulfatase A-like enzyme
MCCRLVSEQSTREAAVGSGAGAWSALRSHLRRARLVVWSPIAEQLVVGVLTALLSVVVDTSITWVRLAEDLPPWSRLVDLVFHLFGTSAPLGALLGLAGGALVVLLRTTPWLARVRFESSARRWRVPDASAFALVLAVPLTLALFGLAVRAAFLHFATRFHDTSLAAWAMGAATAALAIAAIPIVALLHRLLVPFGRLLGDFATPLGAVASLLGAAGSAIPLVASMERDVIQGIDVVAYLWIPGLLGSYVLLAVVLRLTTGRRTRRRAALTLGALTLVALGWSASTYGDRGRVRELVEQRSITGQRLVRFYQGITDRDGDGHSFAFGGTDCDDGNPTIHPGAPDERGDGVDSDCFAGDGTPGLEDFVGDGAFARAPPQTRGKNVLFVLVDALRPDHLGAHGYPRDTSPNIDAFANRAVVFENARATSSRSVRSIPSMMTGLYASQIRYGSEYLYPGVREENELLPEVLTANGYRVSASFGTEYFRPVHGFFQGIEEVVQLDARGPRHAPTDRALEMLDRLSASPQPWFLWVYYFNVHLPYLRDGRASRFGPEPVDAYDTEIGLADEQVGRLLQALEERGLREDTVVVLVSDHGEAFLEHNNLGHSFTLYEEELRSVLIIDAPGIDSRRVAEPVLLLDVAPTLRNLLGLPSPQRVVGRSLVPLMTGEETGRRTWTDRPLFAELLPDGLFPFDQKSVVLRDQKLIWWVREGRRELYDLRGDPAERRDLADDRVEDVERLGGLLRAFVAQGRSENRRHEVVREHLLANAPAMQHRVDARFPGFTLLGYDLPTERVSRGQVIPITFYYRVDTRIEDDLFFYVDLTGPANLRVQHFHGQHYPLNGSYRTDEWEPGQILRDPVEIVVSDEVPRDTEFDATLTVLRDRRLPVAFRREGTDGTTIELGKVRIE